MAKIYNIQDYISEEEAEDRKYRIMLREVERDIAEARKLKRGEDFFSSTTSIPPLPSEEEIRQAAMDTEEIRLFVERSKRISEQNPEF